MDGVQHARAREMRQRGIHLSFELIRMLCVNSYKPGKVVELRLADGHVLLLGRNGAGKTSLAQLIPLFYGVPASHLVDKSGGRASIMEFLLRGRASYIVFEYRRYDNAHGDDGLRIAVLRSDEQGRMVYQFFRGGYQKELFITEGRTYRDHGDLRSAATALKLRASDVLNNADYTRVIQNVPSGTRRSDNIATWAAEYACVEAGSSLRHLDKIVGSMFKESAGFDDLQRIVISSLKLRSDRSTRELLLAKGEIAAWRAQRASYLHVMGQAPHMATAKAEAATIDELADQVGQARAQATRLRGRTAAELESEEASRAKEDRDHRLNMDELAGRKQSRSEDLAEKRRVLGAAKRDLDDLVARGKKFDDQNAPRAAHEVEHVLPVAQTRHSESIARRSALLGQQSTIDNEFERLITARRQAALHETQANASEREAARQEAQEKKKVVAAAEEAQLQSIDLALEAELAPRVPRRDDMVAERATNIARASTATASKETLAKIEAVEEEMHSAQEQLDQAQSAVDAALEQETVQRRLYEAAEAAVGSLRTEEKATAEKIEYLDEQVRPRDDSLLAFLRGHIDDWESTVGKVINPALYHRDDLSPTLHEQGSESVLGVRLDLAAIPRDPALSVDALKAAKVQAEQALDALRERLGAARSAQGDASKALGFAGTQITVATSKKARIAQSLGQQREQLNGLKQARDKERSECRDEALRAQKISEATLTAFDAETAGVKAAHSERGRVARASAKSASAAIDEALAATLRILGNSLRAIVERESADVQALAKDKLERLQRNGIDPDKLKEIDQLVKGQREEVDRIENLRGLVSEWVAWKELAATREPALRADISKLGIDETSQKALLDVILSTEKQALSQHASAMAAFNSKIEVLKATLRSCDALPILSAHDVQSSLKAFPEAANECVLVTIASLEARSGKLVADYRDSSQRLRHSIGLVRSAMQSATNSAIRDFYDSTSAATGDNPRAWVQDLWQWFDTLHLAMQQTLTETAKNIAGQLRNFYNELKEFNVEVDRFNGTLQKSLSENIMVDETGLRRFDKLTGLKITVSSSLKEQKLWAPLEAFISHLDSQVGRLRDNEIPSDEFLDALGGVLGTWTNDSSLVIDLSSQIKLLGEVIENDNRKKFASAAEFKHVSSSGLSCLVLMAVLCGFVHMVRGKSKAIVTWAIDETGRLDARNIRGMLDALKANNIRLITATPELSKRSMQQFDQLVQVTGEREAIVTKLADTAALEALGQE